MCRSMINSTDVLPSERLRHFETCVVTLWLLMMCFGVFVCLFVLFLAQSTCKVMSANGSSMCLCFGVNSAEVKKDFAAQIRWHWNVVRLVYLQRRFAFGHEDARMNEGHKSCFTSSHPSSYSVVSVNTGPDHLANRTVWLVPQEALGSYEIRENRLLKCCLWIRSVWLFPPLTAISKANNRCL